VAQNRQTMLQGLITKIIQLTVKK